MLAALVLRSFARGRWLLAGVAVLVVAFEVAIVLQAASAEESQAFQLMGRLTPAFIQRWMGESFVALGSYAGIIGFGYFHPTIVLIVALVGAFLASELAADVEAGHVDLLLSRPVARHRLVTRSTLLLVLGPAVLAVAMLSATATSVALFTPRGATKPSPVIIGLMATNMLAVACCVGSLSLALASFVRRRAAAFGSVAILAAALYLVNVLAASWEPARIPDLISPFHYFQGARILAGAFSPARDVLILVGASSVLVAVAYWRFKARDL
jgi:ABC-2 type transport system permease protein